VTVLQRVLAHQMSLSGPYVGAEFQDVTTGQVLYQDHASVPRLPASVEKLYTSVAALRLLGPGARLTTAILGTGSLRHGVWHGNLYLRGAGDPTFGAASFNAVYEPGGTSDAGLVRELQALRIHRVTGRLIGDESIFDSLRGAPATDDQPDLVDLGGELGGLVFDHGFTGAPPPPTRGHHAPAPPSPGAYAAAEVAMALRSVGIDVHASRHTGVTPDTARVLASAQSPRLATILRMMNLPSDDFYAEMLCKLLGARFGGAGSTDAGTAVVRQVLAGYGIHPRIVDGSGLSRRDYSSPGQVVRLLRQIASTSIGSILRSTLPVPGHSGTLSFRMGGTDASRRCEGKTGSLTGTLNLAGYCRVAGGDLVAFAILMDGPDTDDQRIAQDAMVVSLAHTDPRLY
jgi:D-alanyl-D-alanine carboxypeptidase/D-alanyl-D-alanine-endopeptidase (penicillin-binding protein 4)